MGGHLSGDRPQRPSTQRRRVSQPVGDWACMSARPGDVGLEDPAGDTAVVVSKAVQEVGFLGRGADA